MKTCCRHQQQQQQQLEVLFWGWHRHASFKPGSPMESKGQPQLSRDSPLKKADIKYESAPNTLPKRWLEKTSSTVLIVATLFAQTATCQIAKGDEIQSVLVINSRFFCCVFRATGWQQDLKRNQPRICRFQPIRKMVFWHKKIRVAMNMWS